MTTGGNAPRRAAVYVGRSGSAHPVSDAENRAGAGYVTSSPDSVRSGRGATILLPAADPISKAAACQRTNRAEFASVEPLLCDLETLGRHYDCRLGGPRDEGVHVGLRRKPRQDPVRH